MVNVTVYKKGNFPVSAKKIKDAVSNIIREKGLTSSCEVSVAVTSDQYVYDLAKKYLTDDTDEEAREHPVLSFPVSELEGPFVFPPEEVIQLGEIIVSYPKAVEEAKRNGKLIDDVVCDLATHGALHLMGIHHD